MCHVVVFTGGLFPPKSVLNGFFEKTLLPTICIAADSGYDTALSLGYTPDLVVGDMDSISSLSVLKTISKDRIILWPHDKDYTDTEIALMEAKKYNPDTITLVGGDGGRLDHLFAIQKLFETSLAPTYWIGKEQTIFFLSAKSKKSKLTIGDEMMAKNQISVFSIPEKKWEYEIESEGLEWPLDKVKWNRGEYSLSNRITAQYSDEGKTAFIQVSKGSFICIIPHKM